MARREWSRRTLLAATGVCMIAASCTNPQNSAPISSGVRVDPTTSTSVEPSLVPLLEARPCPGEAPDDATCSWITVPADWDDPGGDRIQSEERL